MKKITGLLALTILLLVFHFRVQAQEKDASPGKITGRIIDSLTSQPIEYAAISLLNQADGKVVNGATADGQGRFTLVNVVPGSYRLLVDFIGYQRHTVGNLRVTEEQPVLALGDIRLSNKEKTLKEVTITGEKNVIENRIDKMVYNVDQDITSQGAAAADVLKKIPQVSVDVDGNVELLGNPSVRFLINGKPSVIFGNNLADVLKSIPAAQIQSIEVITSPGARYDAEGTGGIINIILKKNTAQGVNGSVSVSGGTRLENGSFTLNARKGKFGVHAFSNGNAQLKSSLITRVDRTSRDSSAATQLLQNGTSDFTRNGYETGLGFDWEMSEKDYLEGSVSFDHFGYNNSGAANRETILKDGSGTTFSDINDRIGTSNRFHEQAMDYELSYKRKFKKEDQELEILYSASNGNNYSAYGQTQQHASSETIFSGSKGNNPGIENETNIEVNYAHPVNEDFLIETGGKTELDHNKSVTDVYLLDPVSGLYDLNSAQSLSMDFRRSIYAGYFSASFPLFDELETKAGVRYEYTEGKADYSNSGMVRFAPYNTVVPSLVLSYKLAQEQSVKLSYTRRIERPDYGDMNPFVNASDPKNISTGNPNLKPEIGDKIELGYNKNFGKKGNLNTVLFFRGNTNDIQSYLRYYTAYQIGDSTYDNVTVQTRENIGHENNYGLSMFLSIPITEKVNIRSNVMFFERYIFSGISSAADVHGFNYRANLNATYEMTPTLSAELFGNFRSRQINAQGQKPAFTTYSFAVRKQLFHKKASLAVTATNFLNEYVNQKTTLTGDNFTLMNLREVPYRSFGINFTYKFGKLEFKGEKNEEDTNLPAPPLEK